MSQIDRTAAPASELPPLELPLGEVLERLAGDRALLGVLADLHRRESLVVLHEMRTVCDDGDARRLEHLAHRLAGSLLVFGAAEAVDVARHIEHTAAAGELTSVRRQLGTLELELHRVNAALDRALPA